MRTAKNTVIVALGCFVFLIPLASGFADDAPDPRVAEITGSGLGLSLAREIIRLHGGDIEVESQIDKGSTFSVSLPIQAKAA